MYGIHELKRIELLYQPKRKELNSPKMRYKHTYLCAHFFLLINSKHFPET